MSKIRIAVIGAGRLGGIHARLLKQHRCAELVGVADPVQANRQQVAEQAGTAAYADYRELLGKIDAAVIATPTQFHHQVGIELLQHDVHLLVEKPLTIVRAEADELVQLAAARKLVLQVGHVERFNPALVAVLPHVNRPKYIEAVRASGYTCRSTDVGVVLDLMIHDLDVVLSMVRSEVVEVQALGIAVLGPHEDMAQARVAFANGCVANFRASRTSYQPQRTMQIYHARGFAAVDFASGQARTVQASPRLLRREIDVHALGADEQQQLKDHLFRDFLPAEDLAVESRNAIQDEQADFLTGVLTGRRVRVPGEHGRDAVALAELILQRIAAHRWDGTADGPVGPLATPAASILRGPHWQHAAAADEQRRAG